MYEGNKSLSRVHVLGGLLVREAACRRSQCRELVCRRCPQVCLVVSTRLVGQTGRRKLLQSTPPGVDIAMGHNTPSLYCSEPPYDQFQCSGWIGVVSSVLHRGSSACIRILAGAGESSTTRADAVPDSGLFVVVGRNHACVDISWGQLC